MLDAFIELFLKWSPALWIQHSTDTLVTTTVIGTLLNTVCVIFCLIFVSGKWSKWHFDLHFIDREMETPKLSATFWTTQLQAVVSEFKHQAVLVWTPAYCPCAPCFSPCKRLVTHDTASRNVKISGWAVKDPPAMQKTQVQSLGQEDSLEVEMATHSSVLAWKIPETEEPGGLQSVGCMRIRHDWMTEDMQTMVYPQNVTYKKAGKSGRHLLISDTNTMKWGMVPKPFSIATILNITRTTVILSCFRPGPTGGSLTSFTKIIYLLFTFGCTGSLLPFSGFLELPRARATL